MGIKEDIIYLKDVVALAEAKLWQATSDLDMAECNIQNHIYNSLEDAEDFFYDEFNTQAHEDCEGSYSCGCEEYQQDFIVDGKEYVATGEFEYNRHDKTYYYVDEYCYSYKEKL